MKGWKTGSETSCRAIRKESSFVLEDYQSEGPEDKTQDYNHLTNLSRRSVVLIYNSVGGHICE